MTNPIEQVKMLRQQFKAQYKGHRRQIIFLTCQSFKTALEIGKSKKQREAFYMTANIPSKRRERLNIVTEVLAYAMSGDRSEKKRKVAWKRARAVEYLHSSGVRLIDLEKEIVRRGGIESLVREASKQEPRRRKEIPGLPARSLGKIQSAVRREDEQRQRIRAPTSGSNDQPSLISFRICMSDLDVVRDIRAGGKAKLIITRLDASSPIAEVNRVRVLD